MCNSIKYATKLLKKNVVLSAESQISKKPILKAKIIGKKKSTGRNNAGKITVSHKGGGVRQRYRIIDFHRCSTSTAIVCSIEYDPNRATRIAAVYDPTKQSTSYILASQGLKIGDIVRSGQEIVPSLGSSLPLLNIPLGTHICILSDQQSGYGKYARGAGTFCIVKEKKNNTVTVQLPSGKVKYLSDQCFATIGEASNEYFFLRDLKKAGRNRWLNNRPTVRGVAMNPVDHPHGGGEGKKSGRGKTPWGKN